MAQRLPASQTRAPVPRRAASTPGEHFLVQPLHAGTVKTFRPRGEKQRQELGEEYLNQGLEALIVVHKGRLRNRCSGCAWERDTQFVACPPPRTGSSFSRASMKIDCSRM